METLIRIALLGIGATLCMDVWGLIRHWLFGVPPANYGLVGRWIAHMRHGVFHHTAITAAKPVRGECILGWTTHYLIGMSFAALLVLLADDTWLAQPTPGAALALGLATVAAPYFVMQPGMGAGIAASRTPRPNTARLHSLINHGVFGTGLYIAARTMNLLDI